MITIERFNAQWAHKVGFTSITSSPPCTTSLCFRANLFDRKATPHGSHLYSLCFILWRGELKCCFNPRLEVNVLSHFVQEMGECRPSAVSGASPEVWEEEDNSWTSFAATSLGVTASPEVWEEDNSWLLLDKKSEVLAVLSCEEMRFSPQSSSTQSHPSTYDTRFLLDRLG